MCHMTRDMSQVTRDTSQVTCDTWHETQDTWPKGNGEYHAKIAGPYLIRFGNGWKMACDTTQQVASTAMAQFLLASS